MKPEAESFPFVVLVKTEDIKHTSSPETFAFESFTLSTGNTIGIYDFESF
jgi:hypothetical protein